LPIGAAAKGPLSIVVLGEAGTPEIAIPTAGLVIGRGEGCDVVIADDSVSRRHARIVAFPAPRIEDLGSMNGTRVGGAVVPPGASRAVEPEAVIQLGSVTLVVTHGSRRATPSTPAPADARPASPPDVVVADPAMKQLYQLIDVIAPSVLPVLILGETGVGKEVYATSVHARSQRSRAPFLELNCAALPESILEGELFGHERGSFTGAVAQKIGLLESADGGTVFLDEVGELSLATQAKLLRVIENGEVIRLGGLRARKIDLRFIAATNRDLHQALANGTFRQDLFFRLNGISVTLPPLRKRRADIAPLAAALVRKAAAAIGKPEPRLAPEAIAALSAHTWPGNIRELRNVIDRAVLLCQSQGGTILPEHLLLVPPAASEEAAGDAEAAIDAAPRATLPAAAAKEPERRATSLTGEVESYERRRIVEALDQCSGNQSRAAKLLGISRRALVYRLDLYGIPRPRKGRDDEA